MINTNPELFYVNHGYKYSSASDGHITKVVPSYEKERYSKSDCETFRAKGQEIIGLLEDDWTDLEKVLFLHDYLILHVDYEKAEPYSRYNAYDALIGGEAVCNGYALAYTYLLSLAGYESEVVVSDTMTHAWNLVRLDGKYYYVDTTWDDHSNCYLRKAYCEHENFLLNRKGLEDTKHYGSDWYGTKTDRNVYDAVDGAGNYVGFFWKNVNSALPLNGTETAYCSEGKVHIYDLLRCRRRIPMIISRNIGRYWIRKATSILRITPVYRS